jgi:hypothetical protein
MVRRSLAGAAVGAALTLTLTGCLGDAGGGDLGPVKLTAAETISQASQHTRKVDTFRTNITLNTQLPGGAVMLRGLAHYRVRPSYGFHVMLTEANIPGAPVLTGSHLMFLGDTTYVKAPIVPKVFAGKKWVKVSLSDAGGGSGADFGGLVKQVERVDPIANTQMLTASKDARLVGEETVDGVRTRHYQGTYSVREALAKLDRGQRDRLRRGLDESGLSKVQFDLWVDGQQLPRKLVLKNTPEKAGDAGAPPQATVTVAYRDFGKRVNLSPPPPAQVADVKDLANRTRD